MGKRGRGLVLLPMLVFTITYVLTCLIGAVALLLNVQPFVDLFENFSGTRRPPLAGESLTIALVLLFGAPIAMWVGYVLVHLILSPGVQPRPEQPHPPLPLWLPYAVFGVCAAVGVASIVRASSISSLGAWFDFSAWVNARWRTFGALSFFEFVNIYMLVPLTAAWVALEVSGPGAKRRILRWAPAVIAVCLAIPLFQKKAAVVSIIIIGSAYLMQAVLRGKHVRRRILIGAGAVMGLYFAMVVVPTFTVAWNLRNQATTEVGIVATYALLAPITRTSAPALYYPIIFPSTHSYYGLDLGQDIVCSPRIGCHGLRMPNDNIVVWDYMNPTFHGGAVAAPFQFVLYAQVGLAGALIGSLVLGTLLAIAWLWVLRRRGDDVSSPLWATLVIVFAIYVAIDSLRNSTLVSYGLLWPSLLVAVISALSFWSRSFSRPDATFASPADDIPATGFSQFPKKPARELKSPS